MSTSHNHPSQLSKTLLICVALLTAGANPVAAQESVLQRPYIIGSVVVSTAVSESARSGESEPNNRYVTANAVELGNVIRGRIERPKDFDVFAVTVAAGTVLDLEVAARSIGSPLDPTLSLFDEDGNRLAHRIDASGLGSRIRIRAPSAGRYFISVRGFGGSGGAHHTYSLTIGGLESDSGKLVSPIS